MLCKHGCGREATYKNRCEKSWNRCPELQKKNSIAIKKEYEKGKKGWDISDEKRAWNKGKTIETDERLKNQYLKTSVRYKLESEIFVENSSYVRRTIVRYIKDNNVKIYECEHNFWNGEVLTKDLHHKNNIQFDNRKENLEILCPNCHSLTKNFRFKNRKHKKLG
jgi:hypothetical protein